MEKQTFSEKIRKIKPTQLILPLVLLFVFAGALIGIINYQTKNKTIKIEVASPADGAEFSDAQIVVNGKTNPDNKIKVNNQAAGVDKKGNFYTEAPLSYGENSITIVAENKAGRKSEKKLKVTRKTAQGEVATATSGTQPETVQAPATIVASPSATQNVTPAGDGKGNLSTSGPETFWLLESASLSAAGAAWYATRKKLKQTLRS